MDCHLWFLSLLFIGKSQNHPDDLCIVFPAGRNPVPFQIKVIHFRLQLP